MAIAIQHVQHLHRQTPQGSRWMAWPNVGKYCQAEIRFGEEIRSRRRCARRGGEFSAGNHALGILAAIQPGDQQFTVRQTGIRHVAGSVSGTTVPDTGFLLLRVGSWNRGQKAGKRNYRGIGRMALDRWDLGTPPGTCRWPVAQ